VNDCEKDKRFNDRRRVTTYYPTQTRNTNRGYRNVGHHSNRNRTHGHNQRNRSYGYNQRNRNHSYERGYGYNNFGRSRRAERLYQIDLQIDELRRERAFIREECRRSRYARPRLERRLDKVSYRLDELKRERKRLKKGKDRRRDYRHAYHGY